MALAVGPHRAQAQAPTDETVRRVAAADGLEAGLRCVGIRSGDLAGPTVRVSLGPLRLQPSPSSAKQPSGAGDLQPRTLLWLRLGASAHLMHTTVEHLGGRHLGDGLLLHNPVVRTQLGLAAADQLVVEAELEEQVGPVDPHSARRLHRTLTDIDRLLLRLLGAWSFLDDGPGTAALVSECLPGLAAQGRDD
jgi:hypothetical protein